MATAMLRPVEDTFDIHEDARTEETEVMVNEDEVDDQDAATVGEPEVEEEEPAEEQEEAEEEEEVQEEVEVEEEEESSDEEQVESSVQADMDRLQHDFPGFRDRYRLIKRIGEGMSTIHCWDSSSQVLTVPVL